MSEKDRERLWELFLVVLQDNLSMSAIITEGLIKNSIKMSEKAFKLWKEEVN